MNEKKKLFLTAIATEKKISSPKEVLAVLIPHGRICAYLEKITHINGRKVTYADGDNIDVPPESFLILEPYLDIIFSKGAWEGNKIRVLCLDDNAEECGTIELTFGKDIRLTLDDLFVFEPDLVDLESRKPDIFAKPTIPTTTEEALTPKVEGSLYVLIGILVDLLVDKKGGNLLTLPTDGSKYIFKKQEDLVGHIDNETHEKKVYGFKKSSLQEKFKAANSALKSKLDA